MSRWLFSLPQEHFLGYASVVAREMLENIDTNADITLIDGTLQSNEAYMDEDFDVYWGVGHGFSDTFTVECTEIFVRSGADEKNIEAFKGKTAHLLSCLTGKQLGSVLVNEGGANGYIGYQDDFYIGIKASDVNYPNFAEEPSSKQDFKTPSICDLEAQKVLLKGGTLEEAFEASQERFEKEIRRYETGDRSDWYIAPLMSRSLYHNKQIQTTYSTGEAVRPVEGIEVANERVKQAVTAGVIGTGAYAVIRSLMG